MDWKIQYLLRNIVMDKLKHYTFHVNIVGVGYDVVEAWLNAIEGINQDPYPVPDESEYEVEPLD